MTDGSDRRAIDLGTLALLRALGHPDDLLALADALADLYRRDQASAPGIRTAPMGGEVPSTIAWLRSTADLLRPLVDTLDAGGAVVDRDAREVKIPGTTRPFNMTTLAVLAVSNAVKGRPLAADRLATIRERLDGILPPEDLTDARLTAIIARHAPPRKRRRQK